VKNDPQVHDSPRAMGIPHGLASFCKKISPGINRGSTPRGGC
jgi:hypothetical protein